MYSRDWTNPSNFSLFYIQNTGSTSHRSGVWKVIDGEAQPTALKDIFESNTMNEDIRSNVDIFPLTTRTRHDLLSDLDDTTNSLERRLENIATKYIVSPTPQTIVRRLVNRFFLAFADVSDILKNNPSSCRSSFPRSRCQGLDRKEPSKVNRRSILYVSERESYSTSARVRCAKYFKPTLSSQPCHSSA